MKSVEAMAYDLQMKRIFHDDDVLYTPVDEIRLIYAVDELEREYDGPNPHGPPISDVVDLAEEYGADRDWIIDTLQRSMNRRTIWSIRKGHIKIADHVFEDSIEDLRDTHA